MSIKVTSWVWEYAQYEGTKLLVLLAIADFCDDGGVCYPGVDRIAQKARTGKRNCQSILSQLQADGCLQVEIGAGIRTDHGRTNRYQLLGYQRAIGMHSSSSHPMNHIASGDLQDTPGVISTTPQGMNPGSPKPSVQPPVDPSVKSRSGSGDRACEPVDQPITATPDPALIAAADPVAAPTAQPLPPRPTIYAVYEDNIGLLTSIVRDELLDALTTYTEAWVAEAIAIAARQNRRSWAYALGVLKRWARDGKDAAPPPAKSTQPAAGTTQASTADRRVPVAPERAAPLTSPFKRQDKIS
jgi:DnaD/phage-associated family protein